MLCPSVCMGAKDKETSGTGKVTSVYLGDQAEILTTLQKFYPDITIGKILRTSIDRIAEDNHLLLNKKLIADTEEYINEVVSFLYTIETESDKLKEFVDITKPSKNFTKKNSSSSQEKISRKLALTFCEVLLVGSKDFRKHFIETCNKHDLNWDVLLEVNDASEGIDEDLTALERDITRTGHFSGKVELQGKLKELSEDDFINHGRFDGYLDPNTIDFDFVSDYTLKELMDSALRQNLDESDCPLFHDHDLLTRLILIESFHTWAQATIEPNHADLVKEILRTYRTEFEVTKPILLIDFSGAIKRHGRKFEYPVRVVSQGEHEAGLRGLIGKTRDELKYARS